MKRAIHVLFVLFAFIGVGILWLVGEHMVERLYQQKEIAHVLRETGQTGKLIALTFDDGPDPTGTEALLGLLREKNVRATFFLVGTRVLEYPGYVQNIVADGHVVGNHTMTHPHTLPFSAGMRVGEEVLGTEAIIRELVPCRTALFRPPYGSTSVLLRTYLKKLGYTSILWDEDPHDYRTRTTPDILTKRILKHAHSGSIVLMHDRHYTDPGALLALGAAIDGLREDGYTFVTVDQLLGVSACKSDIEVDQGFAVR